MEEISSQFKPISLGKVMEDLELGTDVLLVGLMEVNSAGSGAAVSDSRTLEARGTDSEGKEYSVKTNTDNVVKAKWLRWGSQRITPPNIRRLERVQVYQFADKDEYYWEDLGLDTHMRRLETVVYGFNNNPDATKAATPDPATMHTIEVSAHSKQMTLRTCKTQGEPTAYVFQFNLGAGAVTLADDLGNVLSLDSTEAIWALKNSFGSYFNMDKNNIFAYAAELINLESRNVFVKCDLFNVECNTFNGKVAQHTRFETPYATFTGDVSVGNISTGEGGNGKGMHSRGNLTVDGKLQVNGDAVITGKITCAGVDSSRNVNAPNI